MSHISLCNSVSFYLLNTFIYFIWKIQYVSIQMRMYFFALVGVFFILLLVLPSVPVCIWYAFLSFIHSLLVSSHRQHTTNFTLRSQLIQNVVISLVEIAFFKIYVALEMHRKNVVRFFLKLVENV